MSPEHFGELLAAARRLSDAGTAIVQVARYLKDVKDPATHATLARLLLTVRDCSQSLDLALRAPPRNRSNP
jgi:ABC-type uncharacterized transport system ATPase subunit